MEPMQPNSPVLTQPPFDFGGLMRQSGGNLGSLFRVIRMCLCLCAGGIISYFVYFAYITYSDSFSPQHGTLDRWMSICHYLRAQWTRSSFQWPPYWDAFHSFQWGRLGWFPLTCEESQQTFPAMPALKIGMAVTVVGGGTSTAGPWDGKPSNSSNKQRKAQKIFLFWIYKIW